MKIKFRLFLTITFVTIGLLSCNHTGSDSANDNLYKGKTRFYKGPLNIDADAGLEPIIRQQKQVFEFAYDSINMNVAYKNEPEMFEDFRKNKATVLILSRRLTAKEKEDFKKEDAITTREIEVAYDAVALIGNKAFTRKDLDVETLRRYFDPKNAGEGSPKMVFDNQASSVVRYMLDYLGYKGTISPNVYAVKSIGEVIDYIEKNENAIGFIPYNFISDEGEGRVKDIFKRIKILSLRAKNEEGQQVYASANQSDIAEGVYPLMRTINTVTRYSTADNLEWLFVNFLYKERGAKIFLKAGLVPVKMTEREIHVSTGGPNGI